MPSLESTSVEYNSAGVPIKLPLIEDLKAHFNVAEQKPLKRYIFIGVQHLTGVAVPLIQAISEAGVPPVRIFLIGKKYSTHQAVYDHLQSLGCNLSALDRMRDVNNPYEAEVELEIDELLSRVKTLLHESSSLSVLLFDEGGKVIRLLHERYEQIAARFHCVEQTSRGIREIASRCLRCPVVDVARSPAKKEVEAPMIAEAMLSLFDQALNRWNHIFPNLERHALVIGYGVIGRNLVRELLKRNYRVSIYETEPDVSQALTMDNISFLESLDSSISAFPIVMACTGSESLIEPHFQQLRDQAILVNCGSSDIEFAAWKYRGRGRVLYNRTAFQDADFHLRPWENLYCVPNGDKVFYLTNGGFPINFSGELDPIAPEKFQLTRALMYAGGLQAITLQSAGLFPLDLSVQDIIRARFFS